MASKGKALGINLPDLTENQQAIEEIIARKKGASVIHENEQQSQKEAGVNAEEFRKWCLEIFLEKSIRTGETNNEKDMFSHPNINVVLEFFRNNNKTITDMRRTFEKNVIFKTILNKTVVNL